jgi:hypothetical protein
MLSRIWFTLAELLPLVVAPFAEMPVLPEEPTGTDGLPPAPEGRAP